jgi:hypothetical protein
VDWIYSKGDADEQNNQKMEDVRENELAQTNSGNKTMVMFSEGANNGHSKKSHQ